VRRRRGSSRGQALAEFALVFPVFLLLVLILVDFARGIFIYSVISDAAREGARYAIVHGTLAGTDNPPSTGPGTGDPDGATYVVPQAKAFVFALDESALKVGVCWGFGCSVPADCSTGTNTALSPVPDVPVTVRTCYDFQAITASFLRQGTIRLGAQATLTITH
jgi:hypothetical protein